ncbi:MAG TPA: isoprenylcysteine carboxylmethyltransferase family protein [Kiritimatiellia bacterium]|nr:isoprenylcysteine carboxylmethyltransferase family protein [Kiritimatiellia bacterium]HPA77684.1 isoprenylcysteine carboxylmethyltransferase family protein [Kiritimatiellia bacterium]HQQ03747.1 isoprenylcysteine carboxylmethyltransferase family protein [Kiritimatiellia bacterium]
MNTSLKIKWLKAVAALPLPVIVLIPAGLLYVFRAGRWAHSASGPHDAAFWISVIIGAAGVALSAWSVSVFVRLGEGTAAPWDPPGKFVVRGPYCHVRNPMILGVILVLFAESLFMQSWPLFGWFMIFTIANLLYITLIEEKGLARRFGQPYLDYKKNVPRWIPSKKM